LKTILKALFVLLMAVATIWTYSVPDAKAFQKPGMARVFLWHFPPSVIGTFLMMFGTWFALRAVMNINFKTLSFTPQTDPDEKAEFDLKSLACLEIGYIFFILTMVTGIMFSELQWGDWWSWDPRQTSFLIVLMIYAAYFALRFAYNDAAKKASFGAAYALLAFLPGMFLTFVFPRLPQIKEMSLHPSDSITGGNIKGQYAECVILLLVLFTVLTVHLYRLRVRAGMMELEMERNNGKLENNGGDPAPTGVVRRVAVSEQD
jgi:heme exporter protein C